MEIPAADRHQPVLVDEVMALLAPRPGGVYVDANLGMGGHSERLLAAGAPDGRVIAFDLDAAAIALARERLAAYGERLVCVHGNFALMGQRLRELGVEAVDGILFDLGLSSFQLDGGDRGFSFRGEEPLDMRMDPERGRTAAEIVNQESEAALADILYYFGEERQARRIARFIVEARRREPIATTADLVRIIERAVPPRYRPRKIHVATRSFQALRIAVNRELDNLDAALRQAPEMLRNEAKICVISFHSIEDRMVKRAFQESRHLTVLTRKPVMAGEEELAVNPRARSARLRAAVRRG